MALSPYPGREDSSIVIESMTVETWKPPGSGPVTLLAAVADPVRWRLLAALAGGRCRCVCELLPVGGVASNVLSYHLKVLRDAGLVTAAKRGRWVDYTLAPDAAERLRAALPTAGEP